MLDSGFGSTKLEGGPGDSELGLELGTPLNFVRDQLGNCLGASSARAGLGTRLGLELRFGIREPRG